jgi:hypothetical protein
MGTTHAAAGVLLATPLLVLAPELAPAAALAGACGGLFPDVDAIVGTHRRTLHFPVYYWLVALPAVALAVAVPGPATAAIALFALSAAVHSVADAFGGSDDFRPWERTSSRAVYVHAFGRWVAPRRLVRYDGSPEDLALTVLLSVPGLFLFGPHVRAATAVGLVVAFVYTAFRKRIPDLIGL